MIGGFSRKILVKFDSIFDTAQYVIERYQID